MQKQILEKTIQLLESWLIVILFSFLISLINSPQAIAHPLDVVYFEIEQRESLTFHSCMNIHPDQVKKILKTETLTNELFKSNNFLKIRKMFIVS